MMLGLSAVPDIRPIPDYCLTTSVDPRSWFRGMLESCAPYTQAELELMTSSQAVVACRGAVDQEACEAGLIAAAAAAEQAAKSTDPEGSCEYEASQQHPGLSKLLGTSAVCGLYSGGYTPYVMGAAVVAAVLLVTRGRGRRR